MLFPLQSPSAKVPCGASRLKWGERVQRFIAILLIFSGLPSWALKSEMLKTAAQRCWPETPSEPKLSHDDFQWNYSVETMTETYNATYSSGKRLKKRAFCNEEKNQFFLPKLDNQNQLQLVPLTEDFLVSIGQQIEEALARDYIQFVFFPDMGHSHVLIPQDFFDKELSAIPPSEQHLIYEKMFAFAGIKLLYHTAEQLRMKDPDTKHLLADPFLQWRYYTRNLVGGTKPPAKLEIHKQLDGNFNTVREVPGYRYWGAGFDISASKDGCFPFKTKSGETQYFDLSLYSL
jgi:hypothetical protein